MKNRLLTLIIVLFTTISFSQNWKANLPEKNKNDLTFFEYQKAFYDYWKPFNVENGKYIDENGTEQKAYGYKQFKRWEYFWESRIDLKTGKFPKQKMFKEFLTYKEQLNNNKSKSTWASLGPNNTSGGYAGIGRIATVAFHPTDENTFWIGAPAGGLWVTTSGGNDWTPLTENNEVLGVSAIAVPSDYATSQTIYIGTGDRDAFDNLSIGVLKSTDAGATWQATGLVFLPQNDEVVNNMLIHPSDNSIIYTATSAGLYKTVDAGITWTQNTTQEFIDIEFKPTDPTIIYASNRGGRVYKSNDSGITWSEVFYTEGGNRAEIAVSENAPNKLYVLGANSGQGLHGIWSSDDSGSTFSLVYNSGSLLNWSTTGTGTNDGQAWYDLSFECDPTDADRLFLGGVNTWMSDDGGNSWSLANHWYGGGGAQSVHADKHYFRFRPGTSTMFECNDGGIYKTSNGTSWTHLSNGLVISQMYGLSTAQTENNTTITGLQDNGTKAMMSNTWYDVLGGDGMKCLIDHQNAQTQYGSSQYGNIYRTDNNWGSAVSVRDNIPESGNGPWVTQYVLDPNNHETLYVGLGSLWKSENKGQTFENIGNFGTLRSIAVTPSNSNTIYIANSSVIYKSINGGNTWENITNGLPTNNSSINDISVKNDESTVLWVAMGGYTADGVYQSTDGGQTWSNISDGLPEIPVNAIIQNKFESAETQLYAGTDFGVYIKNGNTDWTLYGIGMPKTVVSELDIYYDNVTPENSMLRASTYGRGLWETSLELSGNFAPYILSSDVSNITAHTATAGGEIINTYGFDITESGIIIGTHPNPNFDDSDIIVFQTDPPVINGSFSIDLTGLESGTSYYCKAYAVNENGTGYGNEKSFITDCTISSSIPYSQDFENYGLIPNCWTEDKISGNIENWTYGSIQTYGNHTGQYCAFVDYTTQEDDKIMLIMPAFDLSSFDNLHLSFWHIQVPLFSFQDELKVMYKADISDDWTVLKHYQGEINEWTESHVNLPNLSDTYYIAFEANEKNGRGVGIDDVSIDLGLGISSIDEKNMISIYPNPSSGIYNIRLNNNLLQETFISLNITDITGKQIKNYNFSNNKNIELNLSDLQSSIYFINLIFEDKTITKKLVLQK